MVGIQKGLPFRFCLWVVLAAYAGISEAPVIAVEKRFTFYDYPSEKVPNGFSPEKAEEEEKERAEWEADRKKWFEEMEARSEARMLKAIADDHAQQKKEKAREVNDAKNARERFRVVYRQFLSDSGDYVESVKKTRAIILKDPEAVPLPDVHHLRDHYVVPLIRELIKLDKALGAEKYEGMVERPDYKEYERDDLITNNGDADIIDVN